ncbi:hypothetical protein IE81DRAFT_294609 [Ceraceosorus guamensis]|uniref:J domain-containing protein n=1 Tax=Ceraceosorus guamensis TaxID=1522189 RepID=A0A316VRC4_9BASI|nr:hypothetical protein IE81DRAFT_294609 [Ceraceosorus guamensis]PWN39598.1 hypothetical protein IE81DRAFT_294609 [Ceraceosorus guamensis]
MSSNNYKYDEEGGQFLTFVLTFLLLVLVPLTYSLLASRTSKAGKQGWWDARGQKIDAIRRFRRRTLTNPKISKRFIFITIGWAAVAYLVQRIANASSNSSHAVYDPFNILGIATGATEKEIKKHYKKLSIKFHPDKLVLGPNQTKEEADEHFISITKAYKALTDETIRKNFELYGHPDGRQEMSMGIALPTWVVEAQNNVWVLGAYGLVFGLLLPYLVARWWYGSRARTKDGIINHTAQNFFQHLREDTPPARVLALIAISEEFVDPKLEKRGKDVNEAELARVEKQVRSELEAFGSRWGLIEEFRTQSIRKTLVLLYAYLLRVPINNSTLDKQRYVVGAQAERLLNGMLAITLAHSWSDLTLLLMDMHQCFVQAVPPATDFRAAAELMQLPNVSWSAARTLVKKSKLGEQGLQGFWKMEDAQRRKLLGVGKEGISEAQYDETLKVAGEWPRVELVDAFFKVNGEKLVTAGAIVQYVVKLRTVPFKKDPTTLREGARSSVEQAHRDEDSSVRPSNEDDDEVSLDHLIGRTEGKSGSREGKQAVGVARAPHFLEERKPHWWVLITDNKQSRVIVQPTKVTDVGPDKIRTYSVQFQAPPQPGLYTFDAVLKSDCFLGSDAKLPVKLQVEDPSVLEDDIREDEISDPDEDTLAGQMAIMRGEKVKSKSYDEDEEEEEEGESGTEEEGAQGKSEEEDESESDWD